MILDRSQQFHKPAPPMQAQINRTRSKTQIYPSVGAGLLILLPTVNISRKTRPYSPMKNDN
jgi:hypothetical protein